MTERRERIERALHGCAEVGMSDLAAPWPEIQKRANERIVVKPRRSRKFRFAPRTRVGWVFALLLVVILSMGAYAGSGLLYGMFYGVEDEMLGHKIDLEQTQAASDVKVKLEWVYADARNVRVAYNVIELKENRRVAGHPAELEALGLGDEYLADEQRINELYPNRVRLTDESGTDFDGDGGGTIGSESSDPVMEIPNVMSFRPEQALEPGDSHRFRLEIPVRARALDEARGEEVPPELVGEPFVFAFEIPVRPAPTVVEVDQKVEANGVEITLDRVVDSFGGTDAVFCMQSPDTSLDWQVYGEADVLGLADVWGTGPDRGKNHQCDVIDLFYEMEGHETVTLTKLEGWPGCPPGDDNGCTIPPSRAKTIRGPWTFEFEVPER